MTDRPDVRPDAELDAQPAANPDARPGSEAGDSQPSAASSSTKVAGFDARELQQKLLLSIPETAFLLRVGVRTVWRLMADPKSRFPTPRRMRGRTFLMRDELLAYLAKEAAR